MRIKSLRELDQLVAEKIFGWYDFWEHTSAAGYHYLMGYSPQEQAMGINAERQEVWNYSTDIAAAWAITEKFNSTNIEKLFLNDAEYSVYLLAIDGKVSDGSATAKTLEVALCLAALKTEGVDVELKLLK